MALTIVIAFLAILPGQPQHVVRQSYFKNLPAGSRPLLTPAPLKGKTVVSAAEYQMEGQHVMRLYRYSFKADLNKFVNDAMAALKGWTKDVIRDNVGKPQPSKGYALDSPPLKGRVLRQSLAVTTGRFIADKKDPHGSRKEHLKGWISVSYNETLP